MPEELKVISPINGAFFDKEVTKISKGVSTIERSSKKTNDLLMALIRFLKSDVGRQIKDKQEKDIDLGEEDFSFIVDGFDEVVSKNIEQVNKQTQKQIQVIEAETRSKREQAKIETKKQSDISEKETKERSKRVKIDSDAKKKELELQSKHDEKERKRDSKGRFTSSKLGKDFKKELDDIEGEQAKTRKEIAKLQKKERKEIYKAKQEEAKKYTSAKATKTVNKIPQGGGKDLSDDLDSVLKDVVDHFKKKKKTPKDVAKRSRNARKNRGIRTGKVKRIPSVVRTGGEVFDEVEDSVEDSISSGDISIDDNRTEDRGEKRTKEQKKADRLKRKRDQAREQRRAKIRNRRAARSGGVRAGRFSRLGRMAETAVDTGKSVVGSFGNKAKSIATGAVEYGEKAAGAISETGSGILKSGGKIVESVSKAPGVGLLGRGLSIAGMVLSAADLASRATDTFEKINDEDATAKEKSAAIAGTTGGIAGAGIGFLLGGPVGAAIGEMIGSEAATALSETVADNPELSDTIGRMVAVPMALVSEDARNALAQDFEEVGKDINQNVISPLKNFGNNLVESGERLGTEFADTVTKTVIDPVRQLPSTIYNDIPESVKHGIGAAVAVPMAIISEDARKALVDDWNNNIIPTFTDKVITPITDWGKEFSDSFEKFTKSAEILGSGIVDAGLSVAGGIKNAASNAWGALTSGKGVLETAQTLGSGLGETATKAKGVVTEAFSKAHDNFKGVASDTIDRYQKDLGISKIQAAAIVGNFGHESGGMQAGINEIKPLVKGSRGGYGWAQWTGPRRKALEAFAAERGLPVDSNETQYQFSVHELQTTHKGALEALKQTDNLDEATRTFFAKYESGGDPRAVAAMGSRLKYAQLGLNANADKGAKTPASNVTTNPWDENQKGVMSFATNRVPPTETKPVESIETKAITPVVQVATAPVEPRIIESVDSASRIFPQATSDDLKQLATRPLERRMQPVAYQPEQRVVQSKVIESTTTIADAATKLTTAIEPIVTKVSSETTTDQNVFGMTGIEPNKLYKVPGQYNPDQQGLPIQKASFDYYGNGQPNLVQQGLVQSYIPQTGYGQEIPMTQGGIQSGGLTTYPYNPSVSLAPISQAETYGTITINAGSVMVNGGVTGESGYAGQGTSSNTSSSFFNNFGSSSVYSGVSYGSNPVDNAVGAVTAIPGSILGGLFGNLMGNVSSAVNAPANIMSQVMGMASGAVQQAESVPMSAMNNTLGMANSVVGAPLGMLNSTVSNARGMANSVVGVPLGAYQSVNNAASSIYNIPNNAQNAFSNVHNNASNFGTGYSNYSNYSNYSGGEPVLPDVGSLFSRASYNDSARITEAYPTGFQIERSNYEPMSMQMPEINFPEPQTAPREYSQPTRDVPKSAGADLIAGGQAHRPSIDEIPININDSGLMLLNIGYL